MKTPLGVIRFPLMATMMAFLLPLPHSNADVERLFSILRKVHTEARHSLYADMMHTCSASSTLHECNIRTRETKLGMYAKTERRNWKVKD